MRVPIRKVRANNKDRHQARASNMDYNPFISKHFVTSAYLTVKYYIYLDVIYQLYIYIYIYINTYCY